MWARVGIRVWCCFFNNSEIWCAWTLERFYEKMKTFECVTCALHWIKAEFGLAGIDWLLSVSWTRFRSNNSDLQISEVGVVIARKGPPSVGVDAVICVEECSGTGWCGVVGVISDMKLPRLWRVSSSLIGKSIQFWWLGVLWETVTASEIVLSGNGFAYCSRIQFIGKYYEFHTLFFLG